jgi:hypothetical protein
MYQNLRTQNLGNFSNNYWFYWSSSQGSSGYVWVVNFYNGNVDNGTIKNHNGGHVRAVRAF